MLSVTSYYTFLCRSMNIPCSSPEWRVLFIINHIMSYKINETSEICYSWSYIWNDVGMTSSARPGFITVVLIILISRGKVYPWSFHLHCYCYCLQASQYRDLSINISIFHTPGEDVFLGILQFMSIVFMILTSQCQVSLSMIFSRTWLLLLFAGFNGT